MSDDDDQIDEPFLLALGGRRHRGWDSEEGFGFGEIYGLEPFLKIYPRPDGFDAVMIRDDMDDFEWIRLTTLANRGEVRALLRVLKIEPPKGETGG